MGKKNKKSRAIGRRTTTQPVRTTPKSKVINPIVVGAVTFTMLLVLIVTVLPGATPSSGQGSVGTSGTTQGVSAQEQQRIANLEQALKADPSNLGILIQLGNSYYDTGQFGKAIDPYNKALEITPNNTDVRVDLGTAYLQIGMVSQAIKEYRQALEIDPQKPQAHLNLGNALISDTVPNVEEALSEWEKAIQFANGDQNTIKLAQSQINKYKK